MSDQNGSERQCVPGSTALIEVKAKLPTLPVKEVFTPTIDLGLSVCTELSKPANKAKLNTQDDDNIGFGLNIVAKVLRTVADNPDTQALNVGDHASIETDVATYFVRRDEEKRLSITRETIKEGQPAAAGKYRGGSIEITDGRITVKGLLEGKYITKGTYSRRDADKTDLAEFELQKLDEGWDLKAKSVTIKREMKLNDSGWEIITITRDVSAASKDGKTQIEVSVPKKVESEDHM